MNLKTASLLVGPSADVASSAAPAVAVASAAGVAEGLDEVGVEDHVDPGVDGRVERH